jgi:hypothetical protein
VTTTPAPATESDAAEPLECWCCGAAYHEPDLVRLGSHPEVAVCLACAHYLHLQAREREDARRRSLATRARDQLRAARQVVIRRGWHRHPVIGGPLRWLGRHLP